MDNPWRTLSSRKIYQNPWLTLREDRVIRPDGNEGIYSVVEMPPSCGIVAINESDQIAMVGQWRYVYNKFSLEIPTGGAEEGEAPLDAAKRELREETGLTAEDWMDLGTMDNANGSTTYAAHRPAITSPGGCGTQRRTSLRCGYTLEPERNPVLVDANHAEAKEDGQCGCCAG